MAVARPRCEIRGRVQGLRLGLKAQHARLGQDPRQFRPDVRHHFRRRQDLRGLAGRGQDASRQRGHLLDLALAGRTWNASRIDPNYELLERAPDAPALPATPAQRQQSRSRPIQDFTEADAYAAALDRALAKLADRINAKHVELAEHDQSDHVGLGRLTGQLRELESDLAETESRWLELSEIVESGG